MRYRIKEYYVDKGSEYMQITFFAPADFVDSLNLASGSSYELDSASKTAVIEAIRLIANETRGGYVICSTGQKEVVTKVWKGVEYDNDLRLQISIAALIAAAKGDADDIAAINAFQIDDMYTIEMDFGDTPADASKSADLVADFFNITEATEYTALTSAEAIAIARDCQYNVMGTDWPIPTWLPTGVTEAQVESAAEGLGIPYHEPTQTA